MRWIGGVKSSRSKERSDCYGKKIIINFAHELRKRLGNKEIHLDIFGKKKVKLDIIEI